MNINQRWLLALAIPSLAGCAQVYPSQPFFYDLEIHEHTDTSGTIGFRVSDEWKRSEKEFGFNVLGWMIAGVNTKCDGRYTSQNPLPYKVLSSSDELVFGHPPVVRCSLGTGNRVRLLMYPEIEARGFFDPGEIEGAVEFAIEVGATMQATSRAPAPQEWTAPAVLGTSGL